MRQLIILLAFGFSSTISNAQSSVVYKRNPATGALEVYQSSGGLPMGSPIYKIKKNVYGYLEIENVEVSTDPFTRKPDYAAYNNFKPYQLPAKEIFETLETLNKRNEYDYVNASTELSNNAKFQQELKEIQQLIEKEDIVAKTFLKFYSSNVSFPKALKDGWYEVVNIYDMKAVANVANASAELGYKQAICKVQNNRIIEVYKNTNIFDIKSGLVFQKLKIDVSSSISNCKASFRVANENEYSTVYFLDNILDSSKQIDDLYFAFYTVYTSKTNINNFLHIEVARDKKISKEEIQNFRAGPYQINAYENNPSANDCKNSMITLAIKKSNSLFSIGIVRLNDKKTWIINNLSFLSNSCNSTILND